MVLTVLHPQSPFSDVTYMYDGDVISFWPTKPKGMGFTQPESPLHHLLCPALNWDVMLQIGEGF